MIRLNPVLKRWRPAEKRWRMPVLLGLFSWAALAVAAPISIQPRPPKHSVVTGRELLLEGRILEAVRVLEEVVAINEDLAEGYLLLGQARLQLGQFDRAEAALGKAVALAPEDKRARLLQLETVEQRDRHLIGSSPKERKEWPGWYERRQKNLALGSEECGKLLAIDKLNVNIRLRQARFQSRLATLALARQRYDLWAWQEARSENNLGAQERWEADLEKRKTEEREALGRGLAVLKLVRELAENDPRVHFELAQLYQQQAELLRRNVRQRQPVSEAVRKAINQMEGLAAGAYRRAFVLAPEGPELLLRLAQIYLSQKRGEEASKHLTELLKEGLPDPVQSLCHYVLGIVHETEQDRAKAEKDFTRAIRKDPKNLWAHLALAQVHSRSNKVDDAIEVLKRTLRRNPDHLNVYVLLGNLHLNYPDAPKRSEAIGWYQKALATPPGQAQALASEENLPRVISELRFDAAQGIARALAAGRDFSQAMRFHDKADAILPRSPVGSYLRGLTWLDNGDLAAAEEHLLEAIRRREGRYPEARRALIERVYQPRYRRAPSAGQQYRWLRMMAEHMQRLKAEAPSLLLLYRGGEALLQIYRGSLKQNSWDIDRAIANLEEAIQMAPTYAAARGRLASAYELKKEYAKAVIQLKALLAIKPGEAVEADASLGDAGNQLKRWQTFAAAELAWIYTEYLEDLDQAQTYGNLARKMAPDQPNLLDTLAWIAYKKKQYREAERLIVAAFEGMGGRARVGAEMLYHSGAIRLALKKYEQARADLREALANPDELSSVADARKLLDQISEIKQKKSR